LHLTKNGANLGNNSFVRFEVEFGYVNINDVWVFPAVMNSGDILIPGSALDKTMLIVPIGSFTPTGIKIGGHVVARLRRIASTGTAPDNNPWVPMLQLHIENDTMGSREMTTK
jgi:hypothetical protein